MIKALILTQLFCILLVGAGIIIEITYKANLGFLAITTGSLLFAVSTKIENYLLTKRKGGYYEHKSF